MINVLIILDTDTCQQIKFIGLEISIELVKIFVKYDGLFDSELHRKFVQLAKHASEKLAIEQKLGDELKQLFT